MLSKRLQSVLKSTQGRPPVFLLPWTAGLTTTSHTIEPSNAPPPSNSLGQPRPSGQTNAVNPTPYADSRKGIKQGPSSTSPESTSRSSPLQLSASLREMLPLLRGQRPHYMTTHIYDRPFLITQGDTVRLPFLMRGVEPGDILRLNKASVVGSRDYTLKAAAPGPKLSSPTTDSTTILDPTSGQLSSHSEVMPAPGTLSNNGRKMTAPHFIPHIAKGKHGYIDDRLFVCRAVVMGVESEPMRIMEKTKRRQRRVKQVKSKHRYTMLKIKELRIKSEEEIEAGDVD